MSAATFKRDIEYMRERMRVPIVWDKELQAYRHGVTTSGIERHEIPGLWFSVEELQALLAVEQLLSGLGPGLMTELLGPFRSRIRRLVDVSDHSLRNSDGRRIKIPVARRTIRPTTLFRARGERHTGALAPFDHLFCEGNRSIVHARDLAAATGSLPG